MQYRKLPSKEGGYARTGVRTPMQWSKERNAGFSNADADSLYLPVDLSPERPNVAEQESDRDSLLNRVKELIQLRHALPALSADAEFEVVYAKSGKLPFVYSMRKSDQKLLIGLNPSGQRVSIDLAPDIIDTLHKLIDAPEDAELIRTGSGWHLSLGPVSGAIYQIS